MVLHSVWLGASLVCGGGETRDTCLTWKDGSWTESHNLIHEGWYHTSWSTSEGVLLIGGEGSPNTTEMVTWEGTTGERFTLKYRNM